MEKRATIYGTPLNKFISEDVDETRGPITNRRARLNQQQTVKDDQGRRRFHGAFTGGFSAGYYNTVDSVEGFRPRHFVTHKDAKNEASSSTRFSHKPEDYMDAEDLGEFGIAPKKIRINNQYANNEDPFARFAFIQGPSQLTELMQPKCVSIGEKILTKISSEIGPRPRRPTMDKASELHQVQTKDNFHGLGYKPMDIREVSQSLPGDARMSSSSNNKLKAITKQGRLLEITGEAFGSGVLDDEDDYVGPNDTTGYDSIQDYDFSVSRLASRKPVARFDDNILEQSDIPGFLLTEDLDAMTLCDKISDDPELIIPDNWTMPQRKELYLPPVRLSEAVSTMHDRQASSFNKRFTTSSELVNTDQMGIKSGLVSYSDLKTALPSKSQTSRDPQTNDSLDSVKASISRQIFEWRPCSLLCKRFNVPNPFPDNTYCGVNPNDLKVSDLNPASTKLNQDHLQELAPLELRQSIFNILFEDDIDSGGSLINNINISDSEDEPQVVEINTFLDGSHCREKPSDCDENEGDDDIVVVPAPRQEPELIELISSSSSQSVQSPHSESTKHDESDAYGPPLPPNPIYASQRVLNREKSLNPSSCRTPKRKKTKKHKKRERKRSSMNLA